MLTPFDTSAAPTIKRIDSGAGHCYLESIGGIKPVERTEKVQKLEAEQASTSLKVIKAQWAFTEMYKRIAQQNGWTVGQAREEIAKAQSEVVASADGKTSVKTYSKSIEDYITEPEFLTMQSAQSTIDADALVAKTELQVLIVTNIMKSRLVYQVELSAKASAKSTQLTVDRLFFSLKAGDRIQFENQTVTVSGAVEAGDEVIPIEQLTGAIAVGSVGYHLDKFGKVKTGADWWTEAITKNLHESQIKAIYDFYRVEDAGGDESVLVEVERFEGDTVEGDEEAVGNSLKVLKDEPTRPSSSGVKSSSDSNTTVAAIAG